jgi:two-component system NtrC family response regulator
MVESKGPLLLFSSDHELEISLNTDLAREYQVISKNSFDKSEGPNLEQMQLALVDISWDPDGFDNWLVFLEALSKKYPGIKPILLSSPKLRGMAYSLIKSGLAYDVVFLPIDIEGLRLALQRAQYISSLELQPNVIKIAKLPVSLDEMIGNCEQMRSAFSKIKKAARSEVHCLLTGENGTGKALAARTLHKMRGLDDATLMTIHGSLAPALIQDQLSDITSLVLNPKRKAFSNEKTDFETGSIFIDDIHRLQLTQQLQVMRLVEEAASYRNTLSSSSPKRLYILSATSEKLPEYVAAGHFRQDFYYCLSEIEVCFPPLREREEYIIALANHFLRQYSSQERMKFRGFHHSAISAMVIHSWPGNIDELQNRIRGAIALAESSTITSKDLGFNAEDNGSTPAAEKAVNRFTEIREEAGKEAVEKALRQCEWNISKAAKLLGISRPTLYGKIRQYELDVGSPKR